MKLGGGAWYYWLIIFIFLPWRLHRYYFLFLPQSAWLICTIILTDFLFSYLSSRPWNPQHKFPWCILLWFNSSLFFFFKECIMLGRTPFWLNFNFLSQPAWVLLDLIFSITTMTPERNARLGAWIWREAGLLINMCSQASWKSMFSWKGLHTYHRSLFWFVKNFDIKC